ncbi:MAG: GTP-binding protein, partial [Lachnospiraceae bacterium]|nr:GTP-binding protein [Lachnospiraceae bacterium]
HHHEHGDHCGCGHDHHHHDADEIFTSWGKETIRKYTKEQISEILEKLSDSDEYGMVVRAKGMVPAEDGTWIYFDMVPEEADVREGSPEYTGRICVIGAEIKEDKIAALFGFA